MWGLLLGVGVVAAAVALAARLAGRGGEPEEQPFDEEPHNYYEWH